MTLWEHFLRHVMETSHSLLAKEQRNVSHIGLCQMWQRYSVLYCVDSLLLSWAVKTKKSVTAHEGHYCALIHDQRRDVAFGGRVPTLVGSWCAKP